MIDLNGDKRWIYALLLIAIAASVYSHSMVWKEFYYPTFGNTNLHVAFAQHILTHGEYPIQNDYSYGGGIPTLYVPGYRLLLAGTALIAGNMDFAVRLLVMLFAVLLPVGFFLFTRELFGDVTGVAAAFFASLPAELLIYTVRPLPQALGLALLPFAFYAIAADKRKAAFALTIAIALIHQETIAFLAAGAFRLRSDEKAGLAPGCRVDCAVVLGARPLRLRRMAFRCNGQCKRFRHRPIQKPRGQHS